MDKCVVAQLNSLIPLSFLSLQVHFFSNDSSQKYSPEGYKILASVFLFGSKYSEELSLLPNEPKPQTLDFIMVMIP